MQRIAVMLIFIALLLAACSQTASEPPPDAQQLLDQATENILGVNTLRMIVERTGTDYVLATDIGNAVFNRMAAEYQSPNKLQAVTNVELVGIPAQIEIYAEDDDQWWRLAGTQWQKMVFLPGFNPRSLLQQEDRGLRAAFAALENVTFAGEAQLEDGSAAYHLKATADGAEISWLLVYLVQITGQTEVDAYIDKNRRLPLKVVIVQPDSATANSGPTTWTMEFFDFDSSFELAAPS